MNQSSALRFQIAELILSFIGALIAGIKYIADSRNIDLPCTSGGGCELVSNSAWSHIDVLGLSIPVALLGLVGYVVILSISMFRMGSDSPRTSGIALWLQTGIVVGGFAYSWYLQYVAHFLIGAFCIWCFSSACVMTALCAVTVVELVRCRPTA